jgi:hypothetical protein
MVANTRSLRQYLGIARLSQRYRGSQLGPKTQLALALDYAELGHDDAADTAEVLRLNVHRPAFGLEGKRLLEQTR